MELPHCGKQCSVAECKQLDFLPLKCACTSLFCREHFAEHIVNCPVEIEPKTATLQSDTAAYTCSREGCREKSIVPLICGHCKRHFCIAHRHITSCDDVDPHKLQAAIDKCQGLKKQFQEAKASVDKEIETNLKNAKRKDTAEKIQLMRLKSKATGLKSIPVADRLYFTIYNTKHCAAGVPTFVARGWTVGRAVDAVAEVCKMANNNHKAGARKLRLYRHRDGCVLSEHMSDPLGELVSRNVVVNGEALVLDYEG